MPGPKTFPCGDVNQPPCPPTNASVTNGYTLEDMKAHGAAAYQKGIADQKAVQQLTDYQKNHGIGLG